MTAEWVAQVAEIAFGCFLLLRLLLLRLHGAYWIFCAYLIADIVGSLLWVVETFLYRPGFPADYRLTWLISKAVIWVLTFYTIYALLGAVLENLKGILRFSRRLVNIAWVIGLAIGLGTIAVDYSVNGLSGANSILGDAVGLGFIFDRVVATVACVFIVAILAFLLWWPVEISRNVAMFCAGFVLYFAAKTAFLLTRMWLHGGIRVASTGIAIVSAACLAYWAIFVSSAGERVRTRWGHLWRPGEQERLMSQLEALDASLLRASRR